MFNKFIQPYRIEKKSSWSAIIFNWFISNSLTHIFYYERDLSTALDENQPNVLIIGMDLLLSLLHLCTEAAHNYAVVNGNCTSLKIMNGYGKTEYEANMPIILQLSCIRLPSSCTFP